MISSCVFKFQTNTPQNEPGIGENSKSRTRADRPVVYASGSENSELFPELPQNDKSSFEDKAIDAPLGTPVATVANSRRVDGIGEESWKENVEDESCFGSSLKHSRISGRTDGSIGRGDTTSETTVPSSKVGFLFLYTYQYTSYTQPQFRLVYHCSDPTNY